MRLAVITLAFMGACALEHGPSAEPPRVLSDNVTLSPLPKPADVHFDQPNCYANDPDALLADKLTTKRRAWFTFTDRPSSDSRSGDPRNRETKYEGTVERLEYPLPSSVLDENFIEEAAEQYHMAYLDFGDRKARLIAKTRTLGLREGMSIEALKTVRPNVFVSTDHRLSIRSGEQTVFHYEYGTVPEALQLPDGMRAEREELLCHLDFLGGGDLYSLRITNSDGDSIALKPGQADSLGDYDIYLWLALYPVEGQKTLRGIDARTATTEMAVVQRVLR